jgi:hypothetical protein
VWTFLNVRFYLHYELKCYIFTISNTFARVKGVNTLKVSVSSIVAILLGIIQIIEYSTTDVRIKAALQFCKIASMFMLIGYNLPKAEK